MAVNLVKNGFDLMVHDLRREPVDELIAIGARAANSPDQVAAASEVIEVAVVDDAQVEAVVLGNDGIIAGARPGSVIAIHSTIRPATVRKIATESAGQGVGVVDAPVSGGPRGAQSRTMCYMVGGDKEVVERCRPVFETSAKSIFHLGPLGAGMTAKLAHQVIICLNVLAASEGMALAAKAGLDLTKVQEVVHAGGAQSRVANKLEKKQPTSNATPFLYKDLKLALEFAGELGLALPATAMAQEL